MENILATDTETQYYIPKTFTLAHHKFEVKQYTKLYDANNEPVFGLFDISKLELSICIKNDNGEYYNEEIIKNTFWHEVFHAFNYLFNNGYDEALAQTFANLMQDYNYSVSYYDSCN